MIIKVVRKEYGDGGNCMQQESRNTAPQKNITFGTGVLHLIQINHQCSATIFQFIILTFVNSSTCFGRFPAHHQELNDCRGSFWFYLLIVVTVMLCSWSGRPARRRTQHGCHHDTKVKPEAATAVIELLMMVRKTPETC